MVEAQSMVAVVGAGPAGLFAARSLSSHGIRVALINRDIKPGGLAEYGIYPTKLKMKEALRKQFQQILNSPQVTYFGNVTVCCGGSITITDLLESGFQAILVSTGAQGTKLLHLPGENLPGVYHAKDLVYHYNKLPPFSLRKFLIGRKVALVGAGNVMLDVARYLIQEVKVDEVIAVVRRGPAEVKFTKKEMETVACNLDLDAAKIELTRLEPYLNLVDQDVSAEMDAFLGMVQTSQKPTSATRLRFEFLSSPVRIVGNWTDGVNALEVENNVLVASNGRIQARGLTTTRQIEVDTVIFCIGDKVDNDFCLPTNGNAYVQVTEPRFPIEGISYEAFDPEAGQPMRRIFLAGWARQASTGLVGLARKDGENAARAVLQFLQSQRQLRDIENVFLKFERQLQDSVRRVVTKDHLVRLAEVEQTEGANHGLENFKFPTNEDMLTAMGF